jgi:hypothetical protein
MKILWIEVDFLISGITPISILVKEIQRLQDGVSVQSIFWNSFCCSQFLPNLTSEPEKVIYNKVVDNFLIFPTKLSTPKLDNQRASYECFTALLYGHLASKISATYIMLPFIVSTPKIW